MSDNPWIPCNSNNVGYNLKCETCMVRGKHIVYEGEIAHSAWVIGGEWILEWFENKSVFNMHNEIEHPNEDMKILMQITKRFKDPLTRQANKTVRISNRAKLNCWIVHKIQPPISRITIEKRNSLTNCQVASWTIKVTLP